MKSSINRNIKKIVVMEIVVASLFLSACSNTLSGSNESFALHPVDEMKDGPGIFSGEKGGFYIVGGDKKAKAKAEAIAAKEQSSVKDLSLNETSKVLDDRIKKLEKDQAELELLKQQIDKKLQAQ